MYMPGSTLTDSTEQANKPETAPPPDAATDAGKIVRQPRQKKTDKSAKRAAGGYRPPTLAGTRGPDPTTPLADVQLSVGVIVGTHALNGEMRVKLTTDDPEHLATVNELLVGEKRTPYQVESIRFHQGLALLGLVGVDTIEEAELMRGLALRIPGASVRPLQDNEYFLYQVVGLAVRDEAGEAIGTVTDVIETGANMVFVVTNEETGKEELFPSIPDVIVELKPAEGYMVVRRLEYWD